MKISAWRKVTASAFVAALVVGCVVSSGDDDNEEDGGVVGGSAGKGGSAGSAAGTGGKAGSGGSSGSTAGTGGSGGGSSGAVCDPKDGGARGSTPGASCAPEADGGPDLACQTCVQTNCCNDWKACVARNPNDPCGYGGPKNQGEIICFQECVFGVLEEGGVASNSVIASCAGSCATQGCGTISAATNDMVTCLSGPCFDTCLQN